MCSEEYIYRDPKLESMLDYWRLIKIDPQRFDGIFDRIIEDMIAAGKWIESAKALRSQ